MARKSIAGMIDLRDQDSAELDITVYGDRESLRMRRAIAALADPEVSAATYRLANFGETCSASSWEKFPEATWLMVAYQAAVALDRLPDPEEARP
jgi:hypothetical protein